MANKNLNKAKEAKKDEFYTQLEDINNELKHYREHFRGKTVLCNCDDPRVSNFFTYFAYNFEFLGLKKLITTCYKNQDMNLFSQNKSEKAVYLVYEGDKNGDHIPNAEEIGVIPLKGDGDFRSDECIELLKEADIVVTNPPFSLFREYVAQLVEYEKKFLIIGNKNAITYKEIFPLIKDNRLWLGFRPMSLDMLFDVPEESKEEMLREGKEGSKYRIVDGRFKARTASVWFTNLDHKKRHEDIILYKKYTPEEYPKYDNYDAINVDKVADIPMDYDGVMGVPITFLDKYNPEQFEIVEFRKGKDGKMLIISNSGAKFASQYSTADADRWINEQYERYGSKWEEQVRKNSYSATSIPGIIKNAEGKIKGKITYARLLIRKLKK